MKHNDVLDTYYKPIKSGPGLSSPIMWDIEVVPFSHEPPGPAEHHQEAEESYNFIATQFYMTLYATAKLFDPWASVGFYGLLQRQHNNALSTDIFRMHLCREQPLSHIPADYASSTFYFQKEFPPNEVVFHDAQMHRLMSNRYIPVISPFWINSTEHMDKNQWETLHEYLALAGVEEVMVWFSANENPNAEEVYKNIIYPVSEIFADSPE